MTTLPQRRHGTAHPVEKDDLYWSESYYFNGYCAETDAGLLNRIGIRPNEGRVEGFLGIWVPGGGVVCVDAESTTDRMFDTVLEVGGLRFTMLESMKRWRLQSGGTSRDGKQVRVDAHFRALTPALGIDGQSRKFDGVKAIVMSTIASGHLEQAGAWTGAAQVDGAVFTLEAGVAIATSRGDHGSRRVSAGASRCGGSSLSTSATTLRRHPRGHRGGRRSQGLGVARRAKPRHPGLGARHGRSGGGKGYSISEYMHRLDGSGRPARWVD
jgi:hypothetical protein